MDLLVSSLRISILRFSVLYLKDIGIKSSKFFVCLHGDKIYNSFVCGNTT